MTNTTKKLYNDRPFLASCEAEVLDVTTKGILCTQTVAFPEGGGQEGDRGIIKVFDDDIGDLQFSDTQKGYGRNLSIPDFPLIQVDTPVYHVCALDPEFPIKMGMHVHIRIDIERRAWLTAYHTGLHLLILAMDELRPRISQSIKGCHIRAEYGRVDYSTTDRIAQEEINAACSIIGEIVARNAAVNVFSHPQEPEALYWELEGTRYPCGGTHLNTVGCLGKPAIKRKNMGKSLERLQITFPECKPPLDQYYDWNHAHDATQ